MPKLTVNLDQETHSILKERAELEERSLTNYLQILLKEFAGTTAIRTINYTTSTDTTIKSATSLKQTPRETEVNLHGWN